MDRADETLSDFAARRLPIVQAQAEKLRSALTSLEAEMGALRDILSRQTARTPSQSVERGRGSEATMQEAVIAILMERGEALTAIDLLPEVNERLGTNYPRSSLSPQLSRLKSDGVLTLLAGRRWGLSEWDLKADSTDTGSARQRPPVSSSPVDEDDNAFS